MIQTLTCNLLGEITGDYESLQWGRTHRARQTSFQVGGKGINVSKMAQRLGHPTRALYFSGGASGALCEAWLARQPFPSQRLELPGETRLGWVARAPGQAETTLLGADVPLTLSDWENALDTASAQPGRWLTFNGSIPGWQSAFAQALTARWETLRQQGYRFALDTYGPALRDLVQLPFDLVKINAHELATLGPPEDAGAECRTALEALATRSPVMEWIITDGPGRILAKSKNLETCVELHPPVLEEVSAVGCGDVLLAAYLVARERGLPLQAALEAAIPLASANAAHPGVAEFPIPPSWPR